MTAQELLSNYAKAENEFFTATETNPGYYIKDVHTYPKPNITIYSKKDNKLLKFCVFLNTTGKYNL